MDYEDAPSKAAAPDGGHERKLEEALKELSERLAKLESRDNEVEAYGAPPAGTVVAYPGPVDGTFTAGSRWKLCNGEELPKKDYEALWNVIKDTYGGRKDAEAQEFFNLPNYQGYFLRGLDPKGVVDPGASPQSPQNGDRVSPKDSATKYSGVGSMQADTMQSHKHLDSGHGHIATDLVPFPLYATEDERVDNDDDQGAHVNGNEGNHDRFDGPTVRIESGKAIISEPVDSGTGAGQPRHGKETRPKNVYVNWIIKVK